MNYRFLWLALEKSYRTEIELEREKNNVEIYEQYKVTARLIWNADTTNLLLNEALEVNRNQTLTQYHGFSLLATLHKAVAG